MTTAEGPRFACDAMLGGLARWLRAAGYDASWHDGIAYPELVRLAGAEGRTVLSSDGDIFEFALVRDGVVPALFVPRGEPVQAQLASVLRVLGLALREPRCMACGGELAEVPDLAESSALSRTIAKLEAAAGEAGAPSAQVAVEVDQHAERSVLARVREALDSGRRLHLSYYVPGRDEATERDVDPMRLLVVEGRTYLEGWCRRAEAVRVFRLDRVLRIDVLDVAASAPAAFASAA